MSNTTFLFDCLGYIFSDISSEAFFQVKSTMYRVKLQETQKVSRRKLPAGSVSSCTTTSQLDRFFIKCLLWHRLTFDSRGSCLVVIFVEDVSDRFSQGVMLWIWWTFSIGKRSWSPERRRRWRRSTSRSYQTDFEIDLWYDDDDNEKWIRNFE